ncbi:MAG: phosphoadenosine phosphosulfate reductase family protein [Clostridium paraputrificum]
MKELVKDFIYYEVQDFEDESELCIELCEEENNYHMVSYWLSGNYESVNSFLIKNYSEELGDAILDMYINDYKKDIDTLITKIKEKFGECSTKRLVYESLASMLLNDLQECVNWYTVYGSEEEDMIDFNKYNINNALQDKDEFPVMKMEDIVSAMYGINYTVQPSDLYDIFAHYKKKFKENSTLEISTKNSEEDIAKLNSLEFTPDTFQVASVVARWKKYSDLILNKQKKKKVCSDIMLKYLDCMNSINKESSILNSLIDDYKFRFCEAPNSIPLHKDMIKGKLIIKEEDGIEKVYMLLTMQVRGVNSNGRNEWKFICDKEYSIPEGPNEYQYILMDIATEFKKHLVGLEKEKGSDIPAFVGKYPNRYSATHGLTFVKDLNVQVKNRRGIYERKIPVPSYNLALAEKQATYIIKKSLRYGYTNPVVSSSFGIDSTVTQHLVRRVAGDSYYIVHNNSLVEYPQLIKFKKKLIKDWNLENRITETKPHKTYWQLKDLNGWNLERKGFRRNGISPSEQCCANIKHKPMYDFIDEQINKKNPVTVNYTGLRADESRAREQQSKRDNVVYFAKDWKTIKVSPITFFTEELIWEYVKKHNVPYCEIYDMKLYYEDVFDNVLPEEEGKVLYSPRIGCWCCVVTTKNYYLYWLRKYLNSHYKFLMFKKGLAIDLFETGAKKLGIIPQNINFVNNKEQDNKDLQMSMFGSIESEPELTLEELLNKYPIEAMENMIMRRPCKFMG